MLRFLINKLRRWLILKLAKSDDFITCENSKGRKSLILDLGGLKVYSRGKKGDVLLCNQMETYYLGKEMTDKIMNISVTLDADLGYAVAKIDYLPMWGKK